jgi:hypothetical protein
VENEEDDEENDSIPEETEGIIDNLLNGLRDKVILKRMS